MADQLAVSYVRRSNMASRLGLYGSRRGIHAKSGGAAWWSAAPMRQLFWRVRSKFRKAVLRPRPGAARFGYDLQSYFRNFYNGLVSSYRL